MFKIIIIIIKTSQPAVKNACAKCFVFMLWNTEKEQQTREDAAKKARLQVRVKGLCKST